MSENIAFIGGGNMASALISGLLHQGWQAGAIQVVEPFEGARDSLQRRFGVPASTQAGPSLGQAALVVWAVKPQVFKVAARAAGPHCTSALHLSVAAGIRTDSMARWLGSQRIIRAMPNTPALIGQGVCGLFARAATSAGDKTLVERLIASTGQFLWLDEESQLDVVTALSGSGPAYVFYLMEALVQAGTSLGLSPDQAMRLVLGTCSGASALAAGSAETPQSLRQQVTSKGGTTQAAINILEAEQWGTIVNRAVQAAHRRAVELGDEYGTD